MVVDIPDVVTYTNFGDHRLRGFWVAGGQISPYPIDFHRRPYNTLALPCERVILRAVALASTLPLDRATTTTGEYCHHARFEASCRRPGDVLVVRRAVYGRMRVGGCVRTNFGYVGCFVDVLDVLHGRCTGRSRSATANAPLTAVA